MSQFLGGLVSCSPFGPSAVLVFITYAGSLIVLTASVVRYYRAAVALRLPATLSTCVVTGLHLYLSMLIPGVLGILMPLPVFLTLVLVSIVIRQVFSDRGIVETATRMRESFFQQAAVANWQKQHTILLALGILAIAPLLSFFARFPSMVLSRGWKLPWDTVSYHLPGFIGFLQACSLWPIEQPLQSYSFGFELMGGFPAVFFPAHWGHVVANCYAIVFMVAAIILLVDVVLQALGCTATTTRVLAKLLSLALWCVLFPGLFEAIGKNDIFLAACLFAMFGLLFNHVDGAVNARRASAALFVASSAMALALATKPPGLAYLPIFAGLVCHHFHSRKASSRLIVAGQSSLVVAAVAISGGFFYIRDVLAFGSIVHPALAVAISQTSIKNNLFNPRMYDAIFHAITFVIAALGIAILWVFRSRLPKGPQRLTSLLALSALHMTGLAAFVGSPWVVLTGAYAAKIWQLRVGLGFFVFAGILWSVAIAVWVDGWRARISLPALAAGSMLLVLSFLPWWWGNPTPRGLPGYEEIKGLPPSQVYQWIQRAGGPFRILAANLFPYGLYGTRWANRVVYPDFQAINVASESGQRTIRAIVEDFHPHLIMIGVDPLASGPPVKPAIIEWLRQQPWVREVYCDETASAFAVLGAREGEGVGRFSRESQSCSS